MQTQYRAKAIGGAVAVGSPHHHLTNVGSFDVALRSKLARPGTDLTIPGMGPARWAEVFAQSLNDPKGGRVRK